jgi:hypothetical protein
MKELGLKLANALAIAWRLLPQRDWKMSMRRAVGANSYSDPDHKIESTQAEIREETAHAGLAIDDLIKPLGRDLGCAAAA